MSLKIGQIRKNQYSTSQYQEIVEDTAVVNIQENSYINVPYEGGEAYPSGCYVPEMPFEKGVTYHINFRVGWLNATEETEASSSKFNVKLVSKKNDAEAGEYYMQIGTMTANMSGMQTRTINMTFTPNATYPYLVFELQRDTEKDQDRVVVLKSSTQKGANQIHKLTNIINHLPEVQYFKKLGIQGTPGLQFNINGEGIQLGKSGIFELDDINVSSLSFMIDDKDFFILDYQY